MRLGVLGGSFNPIHYGHIAIAQAAMAEAGLSQILLMVAADPPHKQVAGGVQPAIRLEMARLAEQAYPALQACSLELERQGKSYTADTAQALHSLYPDREICWLIGGDMLLTLENWHDPKRLLNSLHFLVAGRPDSPGLELAAQRLRERYGARITLLQAQGPDISSSRIRQKVQEGLPIETDTCSTVVQYIYEQGLYLPPRGGPHRCPASEGAGSQALPAYHGGGKGCRSAGSGPWGGSGPGPACGPAARLRQGQHPGAGGSLWRPGGGYGAADPARAGGGHPRQERLWGAGSGNIAGHCPAHGVRAKHDRPG